MSPSFYKFNLYYVFAVKEKKNYYLDRYTKWTENFADVQFYVRKEDALVEAKFSVGIGLKEAKVLVHSVQCNLNGYDLCMSIDEELKHE